MDKIVEICNILPPKSPVFVLAQICTSAIHEIENQIPNLLYFIGFRIRYQTQNDGVCWDPHLHSYYSNNTAYYS